MYLQEGFSVYSLTNWFQYAFLDRDQRQVAKSMEQVLKESPAFFSSTTSYIE